MPVETKVEKNDGGKMTEGSLDRRTNRCPNCNAELDKVPGAKTKCTSCGKFIYVRTDYRTGERRCIGEFELPYIEALVELKQSGANARQITAWEKRRAITEKKLTKKFKKPASPSDVMWFMYSADFISAVAAKDTFKMHVSCSAMTSQLVREGKFSDAVQMTARVLAINYADVPHMLIPMWADVVGQALEHGVSQEHARELFLVGCQTVAVTPKLRNVNVEKLWKETLKSIGRSN